MSVVKIGLVAVVAVIVVKLVMGFIPGLSGFANYL